MFEQARVVVSGLRALGASWSPGAWAGRTRPGCWRSSPRPSAWPGWARRCWPGGWRRPPLHRRTGHRSAADLVAATTGTSVGAAGRELETARQLEKLGAARQAWRDGRLSEAQAREIAAAATADPAAEPELVAAAASTPLAELTERCRRVRAGAGGADERARHDALHRSRYLRSWAGADGAFRMDLRTTPEAGAAIMAGLEPFCRQAAADARAAGSRERAEALAADALVAMARAAGTGEGRGGGATVVVRVDADALARGHAEGAEACDIPGVGPVPVATARALLGDAVVKVLFARGVDVVSVLHLGRTVTAHQRSALEERDPTCAVPGCSVRRHLEIDHVDGWSLKRVTTLERLARLCHWHHHMKTYCGFRLEGSPGHWRWCGPAPPGPHDGDVTLFAG